MNITMNRELRLSLNYIIHWLQDMMIFLSKNNEIYFTQILLNIKKIILISKLSDTCRLGPML